MTLLTEPLPKSPESLAAPCPVRPLRAMFIVTSLPVGGAESLLASLVRGLDRCRVVPEICCLKSPGPWGEVLSQEIPVHSGPLRGKYDAWVLRRLASLLVEREIDAVVTVGAGDKMFWGRLAARLARVPVVVSALHSTGWPDGIGRLNRLLTPLTDAFIAVARRHAAHLIQNERLPADKVRVIPNGVDTDRFRPNAEARRAKRHELGIPPAAPVCGIVAALRPEKNHEMFLHVAHRVLQTAPEARFVIVGDGPVRERLEALAAELHVAGAVTLLGCRSDVSELLGAFDVVALTSHNEANPVSLLEAAACALPVVATRVGSIEESVLHERTGILVPPGDVQQFAAQLVRLFRSPGERLRMGRAGREHVARQWSLAAMISGYESLLSDLYNRHALSGDRRAPRARRGPEAS